jgi:hypothetical protein
MSTNNTDNNGFELNNGQNTDWVNIAQRVRRHNRQLVARVMELENALEEMKQKWELEKDPSRQPSSPFGAGETLPRMQSTSLPSHPEADLIEQQTEELNGSQEQVDGLAQKLENSAQIVQRQKLSEQELSEKLKASQEQVAKLERECALLQANYSQQNNQLVKLQTQIQELTARLARQQRYNLQLKAELEKNLENTSVNETDVPNAGVAPVQQIKPWSGDSPDLPRNNPTPTEPVSQPQEFVNVEQKKDPLPAKIIPKKTEINSEEQSAQEQERKTKKQYSVELPSFLKSDN